MNLSLVEDVVVRWLVALIEDEAFV
jgi:hypothetical protein